VDLLAAVVRGDFRAGCPVGASRRCGIESARTPALCRSASMPACEPSVVATPRRC
jgi:hypothetical protein